MGKQMQIKRTDKQCDRLYRGSWAAVVYTYTTMYNILLGRFQLQSILFGFYIQNIRACRLISICFKLNANIEFHTFYDFWLVKLENVFCWMGSIYRRASKLLSDLVYEFCMFWDWPRFQHKHFRVPRPSLKIYVFLMNMAIIDWYAIKGVIIVNANGTR